MTYLDLSSSEVRGCGRKILYCWDFRDINLRHSPRANVAGRYHSASLIGLLGSGRCALPRDPEGQLREFWQPVIKFFPDVCRLVGDTVLVPTRQNSFDVDDGVSVLHSLGSKAYAEDR